MIVHYTPEYSINLGCQSTQLENHILNYLNLIRPHDQSIQTIIRVIAEDKDISEQQTKDHTEYLKTTNLTSNDTFIFLLIGLLLVKAEEYKKSIGYLNKFISKERNKPITRYVTYFIALIKFSELNDDSAFLQSDPSIIDSISTKDNILPLMMLLQERLLEKNFDHFQKLLNRAKFLYPQVYKLHLLQGSFYLQKNTCVSLELSIIEYKKCLQALKGDVNSDQYNFDLAETYHLLAVSYSLMQQPDIEKIVKYCDLALQHDGQTEGFSIEQDIRKTKAMAYLRYKGFEYVKLAEKEAERVLDIDAESIDAKRLYQLIKLKTICSN